ncbi:DUF5916 domain-containing protein [Salegentibacter flavus]|uniref:DUF5916 domain-containing protein n=1 Tax=Salegentibacter flavus TaxID=287099 RepID=A0A1I4Z4B5_9FLAO|nr:DUF5916 domain-containing protein [Salegentibacter flavus]SFN45017.1 hypothetical protein SAMN05660413_01079 [Salegentibacter flavus]
MSIRFFLLFFILFTPNIYSQSVEVDLKDRKTYEITRISDAPIIDGKLDDEVYQSLPIASDFLMFEPGDGDPIPEAYATDVKVAYNDEAIFIAAYMRSGEPEKTVKQFTQRDNVGLSEFFLVDINPYDDGENQTRFIVTTSGAIIDGKANGDNEDYTFNTVWEAEVSHDDTGWYAEIKIPYSALRFPKKKIQSWAIQFSRKITHRNETYSWNYIDKSIGKISQYTGLLTGIENIDPPIRLSLYPYASAEIQQYDDRSKTAFSAGLDVKYGINDAFTLDATLVPDFGQAAFDDVELNLTPFEQQFGENRAFFTEGTELFTKGNLFYSRRVGDAPTGYRSASANLRNNEVIVENPERADLLNAFKISGRTENNLGIGFFNAITSEMKAIFRDTITGDTRTRVTEPFANYNILVLDQQFNQNSSISLINTNVTREGHYRDANVSGFLFDIYNKANSFNFEGEAKMSQVNATDNTVAGFASKFSVNRTKGNFRYGVSHRFANETYDINDLGINFTNNYNNFFWSTSYQIFEPTERFNRYRIEVYGNHQRRYRPDMAVNTGVGGGFFAMTRERFAFGGNLDVNSKFRDFFEPRKEGMFINYNESIISQLWVSSDYRKTFAYDIRLRYGKYMNSPQEEYRLRLSPRVRFSDKFDVVYSFNYNLEKNRQSFVDFSDRDIIFGIRDMESIENSLKASYNFNTKQAINLSFRNFWSTAHFTEDAYSVLEGNGELAPRSYLIDQQNNPNRNFNIWNLDLSYSWTFAPGSQAILLYRNSIFNQDKLSLLNYRYSLENLFNQPIKQVLSLRIVYFIDYNNLYNIFES